MKLEPFAVDGLNDAYYIPDFVSEDEEMYLIRKITESPQQKWKLMPNRRLQTWGGELIANNRLLPQAMPSYIMDYPNIIGRIQDTGAFCHSPHGKPNHVILNEYHPGQGIMPHEDGPSYHPVVATLSLGSHAVFHYYRYREESRPLSGQETAAPLPAGQGRSIDPNPVSSILLEPRSLIITAGDLYEHHLHGIHDVVEDEFRDPQDAIDEPRTAMANTRLLGDSALQDIVLHGGILKRHTRFSLTCRDVERVSNVAGFSVGRQ